MRAAWTIVCLFAVIFAIALGLARLLVPDVVPVGYAEEPQALWAVLTAFLLRAIEMIAAAVAIIAFAIITGAQLRRLFRNTSSREAPTPD